MSPPDKHQENDESPIWTLIRIVVGFVLFVPLWAGMNFAFGTALDGPIGVFVMETPCQRLAQRMGGPPEPLSRYNLGKGTKGTRSTSSVCRFASRSISVGNSPTDGLGFSEREFVYLAIGFVGYAACFVGALVLSIFVTRTGWRFMARDRKAGKPTGRSA
jgi:hypothetical protein